MAVTRVSQKQWQGFYGDQRLLDQFPQTLADIEQGRGSTHFERIYTSSGIIYSARVNSHEGNHQSDRLLFTEIPIDGKVFLFLVSYIRNHRYHRCTFLKNQQALKKLIAKHASLSVSEKMDEVASVLENGDELIDDLILINKKSSHLHFHQQKIILFNDEQQSALNITSSAVILNGSAGAGKTAVLDAILAKLVTESIDSDKKIVMLSRSALLTEKSKENWEQSQFYDAAYQDRVLFLNDKMFLEYLAIPALSEVKLVDEITGIAWLKDYLDSHKKNRQALAASLKHSEGEKNDEVIAYRLYQEFRVISGCYPQLDLYLGLGERQSLISLNHVDKRKLMWDLYLQYQAFLTSTKQVDPAFYQLPAEYAQHFYAVLVDEGLDLSVLQQLMLYFSAERFIISHDPQQRLFDELSMRPLFKSLLSQRYAVKPQVIQLPYSYRSSKAVLNFAKTAYLIENNLAQGVADNDAQVAIDSAPEDAREGRRYWYEKNNGKLSAEQEQHLRMLAQSVECVFIINSCHDKQKVELIREKVKAAYGARLVLTATEVKGLQYKYVVLCDLIEPAIFALADTKIHFDDLRLYANKPKKNQGSNQFSVDFNCLTSAILRAEEEVIVIHTPDRQTKNIADILKRSDELLYKLFGQSDLSKDLPKEITLPKKSTEAEWQQEQDRLASQGTFVDLTVKASSSHSQGKRAYRGASFTQTKPLATAKKTSEPAQKVSELESSTAISARKTKSWLELFSNFSPAKFFELLKVFDCIDEEVFFDTHIYSLVKVSKAPLKVALRAKIKKMDKERQVTDELKREALGIYIFSRFLPEEDNLFPRKNEFSNWFSRFLKNNQYFDLQSRGLVNYWLMSGEGVSALSAQLLVPMQQDYPLMPVYIMDGLALLENDVGAAFLSKLLKSSYGVALMTLLLKHQDAEGWKKINTFLGLMSDTFEILRVDVMRAGLESPVFHLYAGLLEQKKEICLNSGLFPKLIEAEAKISNLPKDLESFKYITFLAMLVLTNKYSLLDAIFQKCRNYKEIALILSGFKVMMGPLAGTEITVSGLLELSKNEVGMHIITRWLTASIEACFEDIKIYRLIYLHFIMNYGSLEKEESLRSILMESEKGCALWERLQKANVSFLQSNGLFSGEQASSVTSSSDSSISLQRKH